MGLDIFCGNICDSKRARLDKYFLYLPISCYVNFGLCWHGKFSDKVCHLEHGNIARVWKYKKHLFYLAQTFTDITPKIIYASGKVSSILHINFGKPDQKWGNIQKKTEKSNTCRINQKCIYISEPSPRWDSACWHLTSSGLAPKQEPNQ